MSRPGESDLPSPHDPADSVPPGGWGGWRRRAASHTRGHREVVAIVVVALSVVTVMVLSTTLLPVRATSPDLLSGRPWWEGWVNWDSGWYRHIALFGYSYRPGQQGPVAFFPLYPLLMRAGHWLVGSDIGPGVVVSLTSGLASVVLLSRWLRDRLSPDAAWTALLLFLLYPYSFFLFGPVYADALFLLVVLGSFAALERGHPWLAGLLGAAASASRPTGAVLVVALAVRVLELRGVFGRSPVTAQGQLSRGAPALSGEADGRPPAGGTRWRQRLAGLRPGDSGVLLAAAGVAGYMFYLWQSFGDPLAFVTIQEAWGQTPGPAAWLKFDFFREMARFSSPSALLSVGAQAALTIAALLLLPRVVRRLGWGYGIYTILVVALPALSTTTFTGMGRYLLPAFPCFAVAGELLASRRRLRWWVLAASAVGTVATASFFARGYYVA